MGKPAGRLGDFTTHGGAIVAGFPTVIIGGQPAARLTDMHVCPMQTPAVVPVPHVGGPMMTLGSPTVLIGGMPAVRAMDMALCATGPPDPIMLGFPTVLIGEAGAAGAGGGGGAGAGIAGTGAAGAATSFAMAMSGAASSGPETSSQEGHWLQFEFVDSAGNPVGGVHYEFTAPDGSESAGILGGNGSLRWSGEDAGQGTVKLMFLDNARWSVDSAEVGDTVTLTADVEGYDSGTPAIFEIYKRDVSGADELVATIEAETQGSSVETDWEYTRDEEDTGGSTGVEEQRGYSAPEHYFNVTVERSVARSGLLEYKDYIEIQLQDEEGNGMGDQDYVLYLPNGEVREGTLDGSGYKREENVSPGVYSVRFPNLPGFGNTE